MNFGLSGADGRGANRVVRRNEGLRNSAQAQRQHRCSATRGAQLFHSPCSSSRMNNALAARVRGTELVGPYARGRLCYVARGVYTSGERNGQICVIKWPRSRQAYLINTFEDCIRAANYILPIVRSWNAERIIDQRIRVNVPDLWTPGTSMRRLVGRLVLVEPFIEGFHKWNSNTGWTDIRTPWGRAMQALSHFSYHVSGGRTLVCDLQGGFYNDHAVVTNPVICSTTRSYGSTDMGEKGISNFFYRHACNEYCRPRWRMPSQATIYFRAVSATSIRRM